MKEKSSATRPTKARIGVVVAIIFLAALGGIAFRHSRSVQAQKAAAANAVALLPSTEAVLNGLKSPLEIRFYSLLDPASTPESLRAFSGRVSRLLAEYERAGNGKVQVVRYDELNDANAKAAAEDGIRSFNRDKGEASYLGLAAVRDGQKESLTELSPEWEQALESDLSRVVKRVDEMVPAGTTPANVSDNEIMAAQAAIASNPALANTTVEQGTQMLRDQALADFKAAVTDMESRSKAAGQRLGQGGVSEADVAKAIETIRVEQAAKMQEITTRLHDQLAALAQNKATVH
jgi:hypothetical protein